MGPRSVYGHNVFDAERMCALGKLHIAAAGEVRSNPKLHAARGMTVPSLIRKLKLHADEIDQLQPRGKNAFAIAIFAGVRRR